MSNDDMPVVAFRLKPCDKRTYDEFDIMERLREYRCAVWRRGWPTLTPVPSPTPHAYFEYRRCIWDSSLPATILNIWSMLVFADA